MTAQTEIPAQIEPPPEAGFYAVEGSLNPADIELKVYSDTTFQVVRQFVYVDRNGAVWPILPNEGTDTTDLASVPKWLWGLIASYGRQLAPALMHDYYCGKAQRAKEAAGSDKTRVEAAYEDRRATDLRFREALRVKGMPWLRSNFFWGAVTFDRYKKFKGPLAWLYIAQALSVATGTIGALALWLWHWTYSFHKPATAPAHHAQPISHHPWFWLLVVGAGFIVSVCYGWNSMVAIACGVLVAPVVAIELLVTILLALILAVPDLLITALGKAFSLGHAKKLNWPVITPTRLRAERGLRSP